MASESETILDIERDLRQRAERAKSMPDRDTHTDGVGMLLDSIADRLKAAWKRDEVKLREDEAEMLLREYASAPDEKLTPSALELKRELLEIAATQAKPEEIFGNAAAMREALIIAKKAICHYAEHICQSLSWENSDMQSNCADVLCAHRVLCKAKTAINAALAAPERNCDMYDNWYDAHQAWECLPKDELGYFVDANGVHECEQAWLFAPAAERKGEN